jgi:hypothetical protein
MSPPQIVLGIARAVNVSDVTAAARHEGCVLSSGAGTCCPPLTLLPQNAPSIHRTYGTTRNEAAHAAKAPLLSVTRCVTVYAPGMLYDVETSAWSADLPFPKYHW